MLIIGPAAIANLLGSTLAVLVPPNIREKVIYAEAACYFDPCEQVQSGDDNYPQLLIPLTDEDYRVKKSVQ